MEIVLGIDNIVFISVIVGSLPEPLATRARQIGLAMTLGFRILFLLTLFWLIHLIQPVFTLFEHDFSWRDLVLIAGGLFLLVKANQEIHTNVEGEAEHSPSKEGGRWFRHGRLSNRHSRRRFLSRFDHHGDRHGRLRSA